MSASQTYLVVGASRGIGKGLVEHLAANPSNKVIATVRKATSDFDSFPNVSTISLDQASLSSVDSAASKLTEPVDTLIVNAAIGGDEKALTTSEERWQEYFNVNVLGFLRVVKAFLPALRKGSTKKIVLISSGAGSLKIEVGFEFGFAGPYAVSKAAANMMAVQLHNELHKEGFIVIPMNPGWVATDMGSIAGSGGMPVSKSVTGMLKIINELKPENSATFYNYDGEILPW